MNKIFYLLFAVVLFSSCGNDVEFNEPAFQAEIDGVFWRADQYLVGSHSDGSLIVSGTGNGQTVALRVPQVATGNYTISGAGSFSVAAEYVITTETGVGVFSTIAEGEGTINVTEAGGGFFSGNFSFRAQKDDGTEVSVSFGTFYKLTPNAADPNLFSLSCDYATSLAASKQSVYQTTDPTSEEYTGICNQYRDALNFKIFACGDDDGSIQALVNGLGDCSGANGNGVLRVNTNGELKEFDIVAVAVNGTTATVTASMSTGADTMSFDADLSLVLTDAMGVPTGAGFDSIRNLKMNVGGINYEDADPAMPYDPTVHTWTNYLSGNLLGNTGSSIAGTINGSIFSGAIELQLTNGIFNLAY